MQSDFSELKIYHKNFKIGALKLKSDSDSHETFLNEIFFLYLRVQILHAWKFEPCWVDCLLNIWSFVCQTLSCCSQIKMRLFMETKVHIQRNNETFCVNFPYPINSTPSSVNLGTTCRLVAASVLILPLKFDLLIRNEIFENL